MKKIEILIPILFTILLIACKKDDSSEIEESYHFDSNDFSSFEKKLFDSLDFNKTNTYENLFNENKPIEDEEGNLSTVDMNYKNIILYPNPFQDVVNLSFNFTRSIVNIIIVNNNYEKIIESRFLNTSNIVYNFTNKPSGIYRLYIVIQDSNYNILEFRKTNIQKL